MEANQGSAIRELRGKIERLIETLEKLKEEHRVLQTECTELKDRLQSKESEIEELTDKNNKLQLSKAFLTGDGEMTEAKNNINRIVREIDKCIALLNR